MGSPYAVDGGMDFGTWTDETSRLIYRNAMPALLVGTDARGSVLDLGGGNGLMRRWFDDVTTVDRDPAKKPDVAANILTYKPTKAYTRVLLRYVLHYLTDREVRGMLANVASYHRGQLTVIQFVNEDLEAKAANSVGEVKHFRTEAQVLDLLAPIWRPVHRVAVSYDVVPDFYRNRLNHPSPTGHPETVVAYDCIRERP